MSSTHQLKIQPPQTRKRKAPTMSSKKWEPAEKRLKELWVDEEKSLEELQDIINSEFGFTANVRQYKSQISKMKLEKNTKEDERRPIVRHLKYRERKEKTTKCVRVRGHEISLAKMIRWQKEQMSPSPVSSPSPLPSDISVVSCYPSPSPATRLHVFSPIELVKSRSISPMDGISGAIQGLFACADDGSVTSQEAGPIFNILKLILGCERRTRKHRESWNKCSEEYISRFRNQPMSIAQQIDTQREWDHTDEDDLERFNSCRSFGRHAVWWTDYGRVSISYATGSNVSHREYAHQENLQLTDEALDTRITFHPKRTLNPFAVVFDFGPNHDPFARIKYQAMIPNDSLIFQVVSAGDVDGLIRILQDGTGRLSDRDEEGRSLLNYSIQDSMVDMTKFLLQKGQDPDSFELDSLGFPNLVHSVSGFNPREVPAELRNRGTECGRLMLEAGSDFSLPYCFHGRGWHTGFQKAILNCQTATFEHILKLGIPFVSPNIEVLDGLDIKRSALSYLAKKCGYMDSLMIQLVDKAILLLKAKASIAYRDAAGDTVLHTLLSCHRAHRGNYTMGHNFYHHGHGDRYTLARQFYLSLTEPKQLLIIFLSAGADVYAKNQDGETPSSVATNNGHEDEWNEALMECGYDQEEIWAHTEQGLSDHIGKRQSSRVSFEDVCRQRQEYLEFKERLFEEHCRACRELFSPSLISFNEECELCGERFRYKEETMDTRYEPLREQYLREKDRLTRYRQQREKSLDEEHSRYKRAFFEEHCQNCGFEFDVGFNYLPERCLRCEAVIHMRRNPFNPLFHGGLYHYLYQLQRYRTMKKRLRYHNLDRDEETVGSKDSDSDFGSDSDDDITSDEDEDLQTCHCHFTTSIAKKAHANLTEGPWTGPNQMQATDLSDTDMDTNLEARYNSGIANSSTEAATDNWLLDDSIDIDMDNNFDARYNSGIANPTEAPTNNQASNDFSDIVTNPVAEEPLFPIPSIPANDESLPFDGQIPDDMINFEDIMNWDI